MTPIPINEDERLISIKEACELWGIAHAIWKRAIRGKTIRATDARGRRGYMMTIRDARAFAETWRTEHMMAKETT